MWGALLSMHMVMMPGVSTQQVWQTIVLQLASIDLSNNTFTGALPDSWGNLTLVCFCHNDVCNNTRSLLDFLATEIIPQPVLPLFAKPSFGCGNNWRLLYKIHQSPVLNLSAIYWHHLRKHVLWVAITMCSEGCQHSTQMCISLGSTADVCTGGCK